MILPAGDSPLSVSCGGAHTLVLLSSGTVLSCGLNDWGQLGTVSAGQEKLVPGVVEGLPNDVLFVSAGNFHSAAVTASGKGTQPQKKSQLPLPPLLQQAAGAREPGQK